MKPSFLRVIFLLFALCLTNNVLASSTAVMDSFNKEVSGAVKSTVVNEDKGKHQILFIMGVILLLLIFLTAGFGMAMAMHGKNVFLPHMIFAGATVFLSVAHAVTSIVWFFPY